MPEVTIDNGQRKLYYIKIPAASSELTRPTILFIHGMGCSSSVWMPIMPSIAAAGYTCIAFDNHGMGRSPYAGIPGHERTIQDLVEAMEVLNLSPANTVLVGHSLGGLFGSGLATRCSLAGAVFISPWRPNPMDTTAHVSVFTTRAKLVESDGVKGLENLFDFMLDVSLGSKATDLTRAFISALILATPLDGMKGAHQTCLDATVENTPDYSQISCPVMAVCGAQERQVFAESCKSLIQRASADESKKRLEFMDGVGHWPMLEAPEETATLVLEFLNILS